MLTDLERTKVVQHILNLSGIAENLSTQAENLTEQIDDLAKALGIECEFVPFDKDFPVLPVLAYLAHLIPQRSSLP